MPVIRRHLRRPSRRTLEDEPQEEPVKLVAVMPSLRNQTPPKTGLRGKVRRALIGDVPLPSRKKRKVRPSPTSFDELADTAEEVADELESMENE